MNQAGRSQTQATVVSQHVGRSRPQQLRDRFVASLRYANSRYGSEQSRAVPARLSWASACNWMKANRLWLCHAFSRDTDAGTSRSPGHRGRACWLMNCVRGVAHGTATMWRPHWLRRTTQVWNCLQANPRRITIALLGLCGHDGAATELAAPCLRDRTDGASVCYPAPMDGRVLESLG